MNELVISLVKIANCLEGLEIDMKNNKSKIPK